MKRVLVTGANGFAGRRLAAHLSSLGYEVIGCDRSAAPGMIACDISDPNSVALLAGQAGRLDGIFHLAAMTFVPDSVANPGLAEAINLSGTKLLVEQFMSSAPESRFLFVSSSEVYGPPQSLPVTESHPINPQNPYAASKASADDYCATASRSGQHDIVRVRPFNHSGAGQSESFVLSSFSRQVARIEAGLDPAVIRVGNLDAARDFSHVDDVVRGYALAFEKGDTGAVYNVCSGKSVRMGSALEALLERTDTPIEIEVDPQLYRPLDVPEIRGDHGRLTKVTGWMPERNLTHILDDLLHDWRDRTKKESAS